MEEFFQAIGELEREYITTYLPEVQQRIQANKAKIQKRQEEQMEMLRRDLQTQANQSTGDAEEQMEMLHSDLQTQANQSTGAPEASCS